MKRSTVILITPEMVMKAIRDSFFKLNPLKQLGNPVMFVVYIGSIITTALGFQASMGQINEPSHFIFCISICLWFTVIFANFAESIAECKGKAQAATLKKSRKDTLAKKITSLELRQEFQMVVATSLRKGDLVSVVAGDVIPSDGQVIDGVATIDESAITGESAPVIREAGGDRDSATAGTKILSDWLIIKVTSNPGETFLDHMIALVEGSKRQKTPNEIALSILLTVMTLIFLLSVATLIPFSMFSVQRAGQGVVVSVTVLIALLVCLIPTTIGGLLSAIGIAGMDRLIRARVIAKSGRAIEAAGDVNILLLDKTGTITLGNRQATNFIPAPNIAISQVADAAYLTSLADTTPEGKSILILALTKYGAKTQKLDKLGAEIIPFRAETRISGVKIGERYILKGASESIENHIKKLGGKVPEDILKEVDQISNRGGTPLLLADDAIVLGAIDLKDIIKPGIKERLADLRQMGIKSIMITGDHPLTAKTIAAEAGVDDFLAQATPETKLKLIRKYQEGGELVAMVGDGTNDAPALSQADVAIAMNSGTQAAKEASNMVDLDSDPTKLLKVVEIGKQLLMTRGSLTTFSLANDISKYFAIIPAAFVSTYPDFNKLNIMHLSTPQSAILSAVIFNALILVFLVPLALKGVKYRPIGASKLLRYNVFIYGIGGVISPFIGIKMIDMFLQLLYSM